VLAIIDNLLDQLNTSDLPENTGLRTHNKDKLTCSIDKSTLLNRDSLPYKLLATGCYLYTQENWGLENWGLENWQLQHIRLLGVKLLYIYSDPNSHPNSLTSQKKTAMIAHRRFLFTVL